MTTPVAEAALATSRSIRRSRRHRSRPEARPQSPGDLAERIAEIEARLATFGDTPVQGRDLSDEALAAVAQRLYRARRRRARHMPPELFGEPGWDILLDLFVALVRGQRVRTTSAVLAGLTPESTGLRWLTTLEDHGLVERHSERGDRRVRLVNLSPQGYRMMRAYLVEGIDALELPAGRFLG